MTKIFTIREILFHDDTYHNIVFIFIFYLLYILKTRTKMQITNNRTISLHRLTAFNGNGHICRVLSD